MRTQRSASSSRLPTPTDERSLFDWLSTSSKQTTKSSKLPDNARGLLTNYRLLGQASSLVLKRFAGGIAGVLSLFRTLEALAIGVQGERCMSRAPRPYVQVQLPELEACLMLRSQCSTPSRIATVRSIVRKNTLAEANGLDVTGAPGAAAFRPRSEHVCVDADAACLTRTAVKHLIA